MSKSWIKLGAICHADLDGPMCEIMAIDWLDKKARLLCVSEDLTTSAQYDGWYHFEKIRRSNSCRKLEKKWAQNIEAAHSVKQKATVKETGKQVAKIVIDNTKQISLPLEAPVIKSIWTIVCNTSSEYRFPACYVLHNLKYYATQELARRELKHLADEKRYAFAVKWLTDEDKPDHFAYLFGSWEERRISFDIIELPIISS